MEYFPSLKTANNYFLVKKEKRENIYSDFFGSTEFAQLVNGKLIALFKEKEPDLSKIYPRFYNHSKK